MPGSAKRAAVPDFYVALNLVGDGPSGRPGLPHVPATEAVVRVTATGETQATVSPPEPYGTFTGVAAAADNRTFVLAAQVPGQLPLRSIPPNRFFRLRIDPFSRTEAGRTRLAPVPIPRQPPGQAVFDFALSPDATRLAVAAGPFNQAGLRVFSMDTGHERVWDGPRVGPAFGPGAMHGSLSWAADGRTLALLSFGDRPADDGVRLLDTEAPGDSLLASSRLVLPTPTGPANPTGNYWRQVRISPDGQTIVAVLQVHAPAPSGRMGPVSQELVAFSTRTGALQRTLNSIPVHGEYQKVLWASPAAERLIVSGTRPGDTAGVLSPERFTPIAWPSRTIAAAW